MMNEEIESVTINKDNDRLFRDTIKKPKKDDDLMEESTEQTGQLQYFTE